MIKLKEEKIIYYMKDYIIRPEHEEFFTRIVEKHHRQNIRSDIPAKVTNSGTAKDAGLNFTIPKRKEVTK